MRNTLRLALLLAAAITIAAQTNAAAPPLSPAFRPAGQAAYASINRVDALTNSETEYAPEKLDAQKALGSAQQKATSDADKSAVEILHALLETKALLREFTRERNTWQMDHAGHLIRQCYFEAQQIFDPQPSGGKPKPVEAYRAPACVKDYNLVVSKLVSTPVP